MDSKDFVNLTNRRIRGFIHKFFVFQFQLSPHFLSRNSDHSVLEMSWGIIGNEMPDANKKACNPDFISDCCSIGSDNGGSCFVIINAGYAGNLTDIMTRTD
jgi:hypothetical protein